MGRYVGQRWVESLPSLSPADQVQGNNVPTSASSPSAGGGGGSLTVAGAPYNPQGSTAAMNAAGFLDTTAGRAGYAAQGGAAGGGAQGFNAQAAQIAAQVADNAAQQEYLRRRLNLDTDIEAHRQAQVVWQRTFDQENQKFQQGIATGNITGTYNGAPTEAAREFNASNALATQSEQNKTSLGYLDLISKLSGPQDYGAYLRTLGSTPGGLRDLVSAAAGKYVPAAGATTGVASVPASLGGLVNAATTGQSGGTNYADYMQAAQGLPPGNQISPDAWNVFTTSQKQALLGMYGQRGDIPQDVSDLYKQSLPQYAYSGAPTGSVKL